MIQYNNFLIKREQSQACLSFAKREKSRLLAKTILTLVALFAVTAGAWAQDAFGVKELVPPADWENDETYATKGDFPGFDGITIDQAKAWTGAPSSGWAVLFYNFDGEDISYAYFLNGTFNSSGSNILQRMNIYNDFANGVKQYYTAAASSGPEVAWDKDKKTGTFTMPGGNVTLEPEYYPQATVADGGVTAADADARATTDDPLVKVDATKLTGAKKLMYFVSNSGTTAPAYDAEGWTDQLPTAEGFTQQGIVYVWYYPVGIDEGVDGATATYSDGDICLQSITARIADAPTYAVTFAEGTDPNEWTASPATDVKKGQTVTVTYTGSKKVLGVKAEKKAAVLTITVAKGSTDLSGDKLLYYTPGETYRQAIANHPENKLDGGLGWNIWDGGNDATIFYKESTDKSRDLSIDGDQHFRPTDSINLDTVIDPTLNFYFVAQF